jgi:hypothetical protein
MSDANNDKGKPVHDLGRQCLTLLPSSAPLKKRRIVSEAEDHESRSGAAMGFDDGVHCKSVQPEHCRFKPHPDCCVSTATSAPSNAESSRANGTASPSVDSLQHSSERKRYSLVSETVGPKEKVTGKTSIELEATFKIAPPSDPILVDAMTRGMSVLSEAAFRSSPIEADDIASNLRPSIDLEEITGSATAMAPPPAIVRSSAGYKDCSQEQPKEAETSGKSRSYTRKGSFSDGNETFPTKLHSILSNPSFSHIVSVSSP